MLNASEMRDGSSCVIGTDLVFGKWKGNTQGQSEFAFMVQSESRRWLDQVDIQLEHRGHSTAFVDWN